ncbi:MAG: LLM class flavin-dependent oxidoreductase [Solirubrobacterales bacterium]|nr:LLM class flavin-dependent oxidoreductase [Solirubrobacterales bacterium]
MNAMERVSVGIMGDTPGDMAALAKKAEAAGIESVWAIELFRNAFTQTTWLGANTETVDVGTAIAWGFVRSPMTMAMSAMDIDEITGGRFRLGLGPGVKRLNENWHNAEYGRPAPHLRETIESVRAIIQAAAAGEAVAYKGEYYDLDIKGWYRATPPVRADIPIYTAAVQKGMARMAGDVADGLIGHPLCSARWIEQEIVPAFELGLSRSGRERSSFTYLPSICVAIDDDYERGLDAARRTVAFYSTVKTYMPLYELHGFGQNAVAAGEAFRRGDIQGVADAIPDEMVETYCAVGSPDQVKEKVAEVAQFADAIFPGAPTYFIPNEQVTEYNERIIETFGPRSGD